MSDSGGVPTEGGEPKFPHANVVAVRVFADVLASTVGPRSTDKMVINALATRSEGHPANEPVDDVTITGDGATLLEALPSEHPVAPLVLRLIGPERKGDTDVEGERIPDGIATTVVLTGALLDGATDLIDRGLHPYDVRRGYAAARAAALDALAEATRPLEGFEEPRAVARSVARSAMTGNDVGGFADRWADLAVDAVDLVGMPDEETFAVRTVSRGSIEDSRLVRGAVLDTDHRVTEAMPKRVEDATVLVLGGYKRALQDPDAWTEDVHVEMASPDDADEMEAVYAGRRWEVVSRMERLGVDVVVARLGISDDYIRLLEEKGIVGIRGVNRITLRQVALATGARTVKDPSAFEAEDLGHAGVVEEVMREPRRGRRKNRFMTVVDGCEAPRSVAALLCGVTDQIADQATAEIRKAAAAVAAARGATDHVPGVVPGGGAAELRMAAAVREAAAGEGSRAALAMDAYADALESVVAALVKNAGADRIGTLADLRAARADGVPDAGFVLPAGEVASATEAGVLDPVAYKRRMVDGATDVADLIARIDDAVDATFTEEPSGPEDAIYDEEAEKHMDYLDDENTTSRWDR
jgi:chaperonin GroEL (HSP60 family)